MALSSLRRPGVLIALVGVVVVVLAGVVGLYQWWANHLPQQGQPRYEQYAEAFEIGTAALDAGSTLHQTAEEQLTQAIKLVPQEPAAWANRGLLYLRKSPQQKERAAADLAQANRLAPDNPDIQEMLALLAEYNGNLEKAAEHLRAALEKTPNDPRRLYRLAETIEKLNLLDSDRQRQEILERIVKQRPGNMPAQMRLAELAARRNDRPTLHATLKALRRQALNWQGKEDQVAAARAKLAEIEQEAKGKFVPSDFAITLAGLDNLLKPLAGYTRGFTELRPSDDSQVGSSLQNFLVLTPLRPSPDEPDLEVSFELGDALEFPGDARDWTWGGPVWLDGEAGPSLFVANARQVRRADAAGAALTFPSGAKGEAPGLFGVVAIDWNNDQRTDLLLAGAGGMRFFQQKAGKAFEDVTAATKLPAAVLQGDYFGAWPADVDMDGDLDVILAPRQGAPQLLRNNLDGTFTLLPIFPGVDSLRALAWADLDNDGANDAALLDGKGRLHVFLNERGGLFRKLAVPGPDTRYAALAIADVNADGRFDLVALRQDGKLVALSLAEKGDSWKVEELASLEKKLPLDPGEVRLQAIDLDSNGAIDLVLRTSKGGVAWLADGKGSFVLLPNEVPPGLSDVFPIEKGKLGLIAQQKGKFARCAVIGDKGYHFDEFRLRADPTGTGDSRLNSFALGSEAEVRTGSLIVKQPVDRPVTPFGLGRRNRVDVLRLVWTTGSPQYELKKPGDEVIRIMQRLTSSCPFLFGWDGKQMAFVTDFCWSSPLGMYINAQDTGGPLQTTDWVKVRGEQLAPREGVYDLRVNANLWEVDFLDHLALRVVDHPPGTEMHIDERFFLTPTPPRVYLTGPSRPVARAWDHKGKDVTEVVKEIDGRYLDRAGRGLYQGVTRDHWVEVSPGEAPPGEGPVYLLAHGWLHPTDSSINFALEQGKHDKPRPLALEVEDGKGGWKQVGPFLGFPAGKNKTLVIRIDGLDGKGVPRRLRLRTNLEIFWDALHVARGLDEKQCRIVTLGPKKADLRFRGILRMSQANRSSPELPHYDDIVCRGQFWRDLEGYYTRFGDVSELLEKVDDRCVIMNAGDELRLSFAAPPAPPGGWKRDFVWVCDGWTKDGNLNTRFGKTVLPLPWRGMKDYVTQPGRLQDDPVYKRFPRDWEVFHTRYVTPAAFERGLRNFAAPTRNGR